MSRSRVRAGIALLLILGLAVGLPLLYRRHRSSVAREAEREAPVVAASRVKAAPDGEAVVVLDSADLRRVGLTVAVLRTVSGRAEREVPGEVVPDPERVATLRAPLAGRITVPQGSRWPGLGDRVRAGVPLVRVSDARPLAPSLAGVVTRVGVRPGEIVAAGEVLLEITDYSRPLVRLPWPSGDMTAPPATLAIRPTSGSSLLPARFVARAPEADPLTHRPAYLYRAERGWRGAAPGGLVTALVPAGPPAAGAFVPDAAVVQWEGLAWAYRRQRPGRQRPGRQRPGRQRPGRFERVRVPTDRPGPGGWIAGAPWAAGDVVVTTGAQVLLSEEFRARVTVGEEAGE